jgi:hypothetical protein
MTRNPSRHRVNPTSSVNREPRASTNLADSGAHTIINPAEGRMASPAWRGE